ncbi:hypothetical protein OKA05_13145 [Luteolibacter arcticus]|uniref:Nucleotidyltransferase domain-containing protein n=1 Tax=Luteolibacter arcticus TaxID=1581411 RepID=A0ABT3GJ17_9BACT|nr:hypothetical protein [Luteolibacter arcticus]MCW1923504.1 hypothetical protein [Luteolibacter arcticus]
MQDPDLIELFVRPLEQAAIEYMISGSVASSIYGEPRSTLDIDLAVFPDPGKLALFPSLFPEQDFYLPPLDVIQIECRRETRGHFNIIHHDSGLKADIYPSRAHPDLPWAIRNRRRVATVGGDVWVAPPEYLILMKLEFFREGSQPKHLRDIAGVLAQQEIDRGWIAGAVAKLCLEKQWEEAVLLSHS